MSDTQTQYRRLLVIANETCPCPGLARQASDLLDRRDGELLLVAPALNSRLRHWVSDTDEAVQQAHVRLRDAVKALAEHGVQAQSQVGDADPLLAIHDATREFAADAIIISTHPAGHSHWLERGLLERARDQLTVPILHLESRYGLFAAAVE
ncbi:MAG: universal stress protein [Solirubrobacteraceae bacterium]